MRLTEELHNPVSFNAHNGLLELSPLVEAEIKMQKD
jgi:hypothetical protein